MKRRIFSENETNEILAWLATARVPGDVPGFENPKYDLAVSTLVSAYDLQPEILGLDRVSIVKQAIHGAFADSTTPSTKRFEEALKRSESDYLARPIEQYLLVSSVCFRPFVKLNPLQLGGGTISLHPELPPNIDRKSIEQRVKAVVPNQPKDQVTVVVSVTSRTSVAAYETAMASIELARGIWNFKMRRSRSPFQVNPTPINAILPGPIHTVHRPDGSLAGEGFFAWEPQATADSWVPQIHEKDSASLTTSVEQLRIRIHGIPYAADVETGFRRYCRALDHLDHHVSFGKLWALMEFLTDSGSDHDKMLRRLSFLWAKDQERSFANLLMRHLRDVRNRLVHEDRSSDKIEEYLYQLKRTADQLISFHLENGRRFSSLKRACQCLDTPTNESAINELKERWQDLDWHLSAK